MVSMGNKSNFCIVYEYLLMKYHLYMVPWSQLLFHMLALNALAQLILDCHYDKLNVSTYQYH